MNNIGTGILWFLVVLFVQALLFDPILLGIPYAPFIYVIILILLPNNWETWVVLLAGFFIGLCVDFIFLSGGTHALASLVVGYLRPMCVRATYKDTVDPKELKLKNESSGSLFRYTLVVILLHHFFMLVFVVFDWDNIGWFLTKWGVNSLLTFVAVALLLLLTQNPKK